MGLLAYLVSEFCSLSGFWIFLNLVAAGYPKWAANLPLDVQKYGSSHIKRQDVWELSHGTAKSVGALTLIAMKKCIKGDWSPWGRNYLFWIVFDRVWPMFLMVNVFLKSGPTKSQSVGALAWSEQPMFSSAKLQDVFKNLVESSTETIPFSGSCVEKVPLDKGSTTSCLQVQSSKIFLRNW